LIFTAHSIPVSMAQRYPYEAQLHEGARAVVEAFDALGATSVARGRWDLVYQSRSGRPEDPWLGPDICDHLREQAAQGLEAVVLSPIGFICDHIEVLYDLDVEAAAVCRELGVPMVRAHAVNDHPLFIDMMADVVLRTVDRYRHGRPLPVVPAEGACPP
jgi:ferrochelatase